MSLTRRDLWDMREAGARLSLLEDSVRSAGAREADTESVGVRDDVVRGLSMQPEPPPMHAFSVYYSGGWRVFRASDASGEPFPLVTVDGEEVGVDGLDELPAEADPLYLTVDCKEGEDPKAALSADPGEPQEGWERIAKVPIAAYGRKGLPSVQYHVGVVSLTTGPGEVRHPCRVDSIDDATYSVPTGMEDTGQVITVNYTKAGDGCEDGANSFTIPILRSSGGGGGGGGDFSMDVSDQDVPGTTDHPNGGVKVTLSPSAGQGTNFTVWNGKDGENGKDGKDGENGKDGVDGSDAVVDAYSERISGSPGRTRVTLTPNNGGNQTQFDVLDGVDGADASVDVESVDVAPSSDHPNGGVKVTLTPNAGAGSWFNVWNGKDGASVSSVDVDGEPYTDGEYTITRLRITFGDGRSSTVEIPARTGGFSGTISFVSDVRYDYRSHSIQKQTSTADFATGIIRAGQWTTVEGGVAASHNSDIKD